jgi:hypothetical protein
MPEAKQIEEGVICVEESKSPFFFAIKSNMHGIVHLMLQKGFN